MTRLISLMVIAELCSISYLAGAVNKPNAGAIEVRNQCIDWLAKDAKWRYTMCNLPMDGK